MDERYYGYGDRAYGTTLDGHEIAIVFDKSKVVVNSITLFVDGQVVDRERVVYGEKHLTGQLPAGTVVEVSIESGMVGELTKAQARRPDGAWVDLQPVEGAGGSA